MVHLSHLIIGTVKMMRERAGEPLDQGIWSFGRKCHLAHYVYESSLLLLLLLKCVTNACILSTELKIISRSHRSDRTFFCTLCLSHVTTFCRLLIPKAPPWWNLHIGMYKYWWTRCHSVWSASQVKEYYSEVGNSGNYKNIGLVCNFFNSSAYIFGKHGKRPT